MAHDDMMKTGSAFGKYTIERLLGRGGMGAVYLVRHRMLGSLFALKVLDGGMAKKNGEFVTRFIREAKLASNIRHPNLVAVHDAGLDEAHNLYYLVMDYLPGGNLRDRISERGGRLPSDEAVRVVRQIAAALVTADQHGMVHRDIKPENIMFASDGSAKLADLGIAKGNGEQDTLVTMPSVVFGTPAYMAPEQATDASSVDCRADIWSLGVVLYEMLSGRRPYEGNGLAAIVAQLLAPDPFPDIRAVVPDIPDALAALVDEMCMKDRDRRLSSPRELLERLDRLDLQPDASRPSGPGCATQATLSTQMTIDDDPRAASSACGVAGGNRSGKPPVEEAPVYVEPEPGHGATAFEIEVEAKLAGRKARRNRLRHAIWAFAVVLCLVVGLCLLHSPPENESSHAAPNGGGECPASSQSPETGHAGRVTLPGQDTTNAVPNGSETNAVPNDRGEGPIPPQIPDMVFIGSANERGLLLSAASGNAEFYSVSGRPEQVLKLIGTVAERHPRKIVVSLAGYAMERELHPSRFDLFVREVGKTLANSDVPFAFIPGAGDYGQAIRAAARDNSWDLHVKEGR